MRDKGGPGSTQSLALGFLALAMERRSFNAVAAAAAAGGSADVDASSAQLGGGLQAALRKSQLSAQQHPLLKQAVEDRSA
jgi:hypothetical protein